MKNNIERNIQTAVVTGPTGAIGIALCEKLLRENVTVYAVCRPGSSAPLGLGEVPLALFILCLALFPPYEQFQAFNRINEGINYPLGWTTPVESLSLLLLQIGITVNCLKNKKNRIIHK